jgi:hypothetical protein
MAVSGRAQDFRQNYAVQRHDLRGFCVGRAAFLLILRCNIIVDIVLREAQIGDCAAHNRRINPAK